MNSHAGIRFQDFFSPGFILKAYFRLM